MKKLTLLIAAVLCMGLSVFGQTALVQTTLSAAVQSSSTTTIAVTSATGITAGSSILYIEDGTAYNGEAMFVNSVSGTTLGVTRGYSSTAANPHISGALVFVSPAASTGLPAFYMTDPAGAAPFVNGTSSCANTAETPWINIRTGNQWICSTVSLSWVPGFFNFEAPPGVTTAVASVAGVTAVSGPLFHVTGTNAITAWGASTTRGSLGQGGGTSDTVGSAFCVIPDAIFTTTATNNIALATTAVVNKTLCFTYDQTNKKYTPTY